MSKTSKVNSSLRDSIVQFLAPGTTATNNGLHKHVAVGFSLRAVQEATQKMVDSGLLTKSVIKGRTWYSVPMGTQDSGQQ